MATNLGLQESGYVPAGVGAGAFSANAYNKDFDFNKYERDYNPWGTGSDAEAMREAFEQTLTRNDKTAVQEFSRLKRDAFGYQYDVVTTVPKPAAPIRTVRSGTPVTYLGTKEDIDYGRGGAWDPNANTDKQGNRVIIAGQSARKVVGGGDSWDGTQVETKRVAGKELSEVDAYKLWRYDLRTLQTKAQIGTGVSDEYVGLDYMGAEVDRTLDVEAFAGQLGPTVEDSASRAERLQGKTSFLSRNLIGNRKAIKQAQAAAAAVNIGSNKARTTGVQLGG